MCYRTICLYSLCGHTSISLRPIRNVSPCPYQSTAKVAATTEPDQQISQTHPTTASSTASPLVLSFPSPQEFEFARELHHSVPASPISPVISRSNRTSTASRNSNLSPTGNDRATFDILAGYYTPPSPTSLSPPSASASPSPSQSKSQPHPQSQPTSITPCQSPQSHPLHTFTVPALCPRCRILRESNLACFEAQAIRDSVEREGGSAWNRWGQSGNVPRKKISGVNVKTGSGTEKSPSRLIPLICVEEGRWRGEISEEEKREGERGTEWKLSGEVEGVDGLDDGGVGKEGFDSDKEAGLYGNNHNSKKSSMEAIMAGTWPSSRTPTPTPTPTLNPSVSQTPMATSTTPLTLPPPLPSSSIWSRWISRTPSPSPRPGSITYTHVAKPEPHPDLPTPDQELGSPAPGIRLPERNRLPDSLATTNLSAQVDPQNRWSRAVSDVARDTAGRNVKGMQRTLGWNAGGVVDRDIF